MKILIVVMAMCLIGCGTTTDRQTKTIEKKQFFTKPITLHTPFGDFAFDPIEVYEQREETEVEQSKTVIEMPDPTKIIAAGTPFGAIIAAVTAFGGVATGIHQMIGKKKAERRFGEVVDGVEIASEDMTDKQWEEFSGKFNHSPETKAAIKARLTKKAKV